nr:PUCXE21 protein [Pyrus ussuriensis]
MELQRGQDLPERKGQKRKLEEETGGEREISVKSGEARKALLSEVSEQVKVLNSAFSWSEADRASAKRATHVLAEIAKNGSERDRRRRRGSVSGKDLQAPPLSDGDRSSKPFEHEVEKGSAFALGLLAVKPEHQQLIVDTGALAHLVDLLKRHKDSPVSRALYSVIRRAADAITNLAHENSSIKTRVRIEGGIPPLVELLEFADTKVQRAAAGALRTLAFKNDENKNQIVECNALPTLILMLRSEDAAIHYEAVGVIGNLVHSSPNIKKEVLLAGALQPVIGLLSSCCSESQREAALLIGQFAATDSDCKVHIVQRGAVRPLIEMLQSSDVQLREMSAFALGRLAQDTNNQAGIAHNGGLVPLLKLLDSKNGSLQHNAAFTLYGLADNEDNVSDYIRIGGFVPFAIFDACRERAVQRRVALAFAHLCSPDDLRTIFIDNNGMSHPLFISCFSWSGVASGLLGSSTHKQQLDGATALYKLANKAMTLSPVDAAPHLQHHRCIWGNSRRFYAHRICLLASSDAFRAMFDGGYREKDARDIEIPNIRWEVFELMMRFIYTGSVDITLDIAQDLLRAADQYLLEGLKRLCEYTIAQDISLENVSNMYELSEAFHAMSLRHTCILFILEQFEKLSARPGTKEIASEFLPFIRFYKDGSVERLLDSPYVPPSPNQNPETGVSSKDITISDNPNISARLYLPNLPQNQSQKLPILVYFHGGGFCIESAFSFLDTRYLNRLVSEARVLAISVDYRLAPENPLPIAYEDCWDALRWVASHSSNNDSGGDKEPWLVRYGDFDRLYIGGDSAGGNIAHNMAMKAGVESLCGGVKILGAFLSHPYFWSSKPIGSEPKGEDFEKAVPYLIWDFVYPSAPGGVDNPMLNPAGEGKPSLAGLACSRLLVCVAGKDALRDRGVWYYDLVKESGWKGEVELFEVEGEDHCYHIFCVSETENVKKMIKRLASFLV